jgi:hypothetical protein
MENSQSPISEIQNIELNSASILHLNTTRKWTNFFSIMGFVFMGLIFVAFLFMLFSSSLIPYASFSKLSLLPALFFMIVYAFPIYYLYKFSSISKMALAESNANQLAEAFKYLKMHYRFMGILAIIILSLYLLVILFFLLAGGIGGLF